jgi:hypothetical protein
MRIWRSVNADEKRNRKIREMENGKSGIKQNGRRKMKKRGKSGSWREESQIKLM